MAQHEKRFCPRCNKNFECKPGNITQCQCHGIMMNAEQRAYIEDRYSDCLCRDCLQWLSVEVNLFREKYIFSK